MDNSFRKGRAPHHALGRMGSTNGRKALEGKNVKDMLLNVGSGGGAAAAAPSGGAAASGGAADAPAAKEEEKKEEGEIACVVSIYTVCWKSLTYFLQRRKSQTRIWASVCSIKRLHTIPFPFFRPSTCS